MDPHERAHGRAPGIKDVAAAARVSLGTVSNVLNHPERVSELTRQRVSGAIESLGFVRNEGARQLRRGRSSTLAYVVLDATNPFFVDVAAGVEEAAAKEGLSLYLCNSGAQLDRETAYLSRLEQQRVEGVLITPTGADQRLIHEMPARGTPVVIVDRAFGAGTHCSVAVDDRTGGRLAVEHLLDLGHRRIAFVGGPFTIGQVRDRLAGGRAAVADAGLEPGTLVEIRTDALSVAAGRDAGAHIATLRRNRPTAVACANDLVAIGLLQGCVALGVRVPEDLAIVGYDDIEFAAAAAVPLSSVRQPRHELGVRAAELLIDEARNPDHTHSQLLFTPELVVRASTVTRPFPSEVAGGA